MHKYLIIADGELMTDQKNNNIEVKISWINEFIGVTYRGTDDSKEAVSPEDHLWEAILSLYHVGSENQTQANRLEWWLVKSGALELSAWPSGR